MPDRMPVTIAQFDAWKQHWPLTFRRPSWTPLEIDDVVAGRFARGFARADELAAALIALGDLFGDTTSGAEEGGVSGNEDEASDVSAGAPAPPTPSMYPN